MSRFVIASSVAVSLALIACGAAPGDPTGSTESASTSAGSAATTTDPCTPQECGPEPEYVTKLCWDGKTAGPVCERVDGVCGWHITTCPPECSTAACGPRPSGASIACSDGTAAGPVCDSSAGHCGWHIITCD
jgi:hypothetical protein